MEEEMYFYHVCLFYPLQTRLYFSSIVFHLFFYLFPSTYVLCTYIWMSTGFSGDHFRIDRVNLSGK